MKAPKQPRPTIHVSRRIDRRPDGASQLLVDGSARQGAQREYVGRLQTHARDGGLAAQLCSGVGTLATNGSPALEGESGTSGLQVASPVQLAKRTNKKKAKTKGITKNTKRRKMPRYRRFPTAYGTTTGTRNQGPHTVPHIGKRVAVENAYKLNSGFSIDNINVRTGLIPSAGQARKLIRRVEESTNKKIPKKHKVTLDRNYKKQLELKQSGTPQQRNTATLKLLELNPLATYSLHQPASPGELKGKGERRTTVEPDLIKMSTMTKGGPVPKFSKVDSPKNPQHRKEHLEKFYRDVGKLYKGEDDHSDMELSSDDEY